MAFTMSRSYCLGIMGSKLIIIENFCLQTKINLLFRIKRKAGLLVLTMISIILNG